MIAVSRRNPLGPRMTEAIAERQQTKKDNVDKKPDQGDNPDIGRSTKQGRRAETPASIRSSGPSGQSGRAKHQTKHPNK